MDGSREHGIHSQACLIDHETKFVDRGLLTKIGPAQYTHVLFGPEQAASSEIRDLLREPTFQYRIRVIVVDECHVASQWKEFREKYRQLHELRRSLPSSVPVFACTATLDNESELDVRRYIGLRDERDHPPRIRTIRTSIDRPEISIAAIPLARRKQSPYRTLAFVFEHAYQSRNVMLIPKTIIFLDGRTLVEKVCDELVEIAVFLGYDNATANSMFGTFKSTTPSYDQRRLYYKFRQPDSRLRVIVATTSTGGRTNTAMTTVQRAFALSRSTCARSRRRVGRTYKIRIAHVRPFFANPSSIGLGDYLSGIDGSLTWSEHLQHVLIFCVTHGNS